jgi:ABC-type cobalamin/Fe3+-siderophores transport system ATPase subunit
MKIDLHTHTKKCKSGDAHTRAIAPADFCEILTSTEVGILAITNHNVFDLTQFKEIEDGLSGSVQVWPGVELDVIEDGSRGHLLVIVSPTRAAEFSESVNQLTSGSTPDDFTTTISEILKVFDPLEPLYVAHYKQKTPNISDEALEVLMAGTVNPGRVIKEVTNSISAGIYISHGHASIYGSDVHDWATYEEESMNLPDLRLPVESFEHFCLLLEKDPTTINTVLDKKIAENLSLTPFEDGTLLGLRIFNDINVVFGPKGTGKSCILAAIARYYSKTGIEATVYEPASDRLDDIFDTKGRDLSLNLNNYSINYCKDEIEELREASEVDVTSVGKYVNYFRTKTTNKNAKKIKIKNLDTEEEGPPRRAFRQFNEGSEKAAEFLAFLEDHPAVQEVLTQEELEELTRSVTELLNRLGDKQWDTFSGWKEICLLNSAIEKFRAEVERKTGSPAKPTTPGFRDYALNRARIAANATKVLKSLDTTIPMQLEPVGSLGPNKGDLELRTEFRFQNGTLTDGELNKLKGVKKGSQKQFARKVREILQHAYKDDLFQHVAGLNEVEDVEHIETVYELLLFKRYFALDGKRYAPSSGEASMVMLQKELETDKEIYILDEPERSLGNEYINDVIVPLIKERARAGKKVFISTHDANIAVRTLPYSSVYRCHGPDGYATYIGNPFSNNLVNPEKCDDVLDWKKVCMRTLEGGEEAFGERGKIYGNG